MPDLILNSIESMSFQRNFNFLGDIFNFNSVDSYSLRSRVKSTGELEYSIRPIWSGLYNRTSSGLAYYGFIIDGINLGTGKITSFNWEESTDVLDRKFSMTFEIYESGNLKNLSGYRYSDIDQSIFTGDFKYVNDFQESISISQDGTSVQTMEQSVSFGIDDPVSPEDKIALKNKIFSGFAANRLPSLGIRTLYPSIISGNSNSGYIAYYSETVDSINSQYSFSKRSSYDNNKKATWEYSHSFNFNGNESIVVENGNIKSIFFQGLSGYRNLTGARDRWNEVKTGIYDRVNNTFYLMSGFSGLFNTGYFSGLINYPIERRFNENPLDGSIDYSYTYSNNSAISLSGYIFTNSRSFRYGEKGFAVIVENGEYIGMSTSNSGRFQNAYSGYINNESLILPRITGTFLLGKRLNDFTCEIASGFNKTLEDTTYQEFNGIVSYSKTYSNDPSLYNNDPNFIKYTQVITDNQPVHLHNKFLIPGYEEYVQSSDQSTEGSWINNITIVGKKGVSIDDYLNESFSKVIKPTGSGMMDAFLKSMNYSYSPFENTFEASFEYYYSKYKESENYLI
jgi:hypothetical protein